jgi:hypothetical protein
MADLSGNTVSLDIGLTSVRGLAPMDDVVAKTIAIRDRIPSSVHADLILEWVASRGR